MLNQCVFSQGVRITLAHCANHRYLYFCGANFSTVHTLAHCAQYSHKFLAMFLRVVALHSQSHQELFGVDNEVPQLPQA